MSIVDRIEHAVTNCANCRQHDIETRVLEVCADVLRTQTRPTPTLPTSAWPLGRPWTTGKEPR